MLVAWTSAVQHPTPRDGSDGVPSQFRWRIRRPKMRNVYVNSCSLIALSDCTGTGTTYLLKCMVRRLTAREKLVDEESLRQCIRPVVWRGVSWP